MQKIDATLWGDLLNENDNSLPNTAYTNKQTIRLKHILDNMLIAVRKLNTGTISLVRRLKWDGKHEYVATESLLAFQTRESKVLKYILFRYMNEQRD